MSFDLSLHDPETGRVIESDVAVPTGGTYAPDSRALEFNVTFNYSEHIRPVMPGLADGFYSVDGMPAMDFAWQLLEAIPKLGQDVSDDYWEPTEGNARRALESLLWMCMAAPHGVWRVDG